MRRNTILRQARNHKIRKDEAAAALEAKSDQRGLGQEAYGGKQRKEGCWRLEAEEACGGKKGCRDKETSS